MTWTRTGVPPEVLPADPANALQSLVSRLRRALDVAEIVTQTATGYRLALTPDTVDVHRFERLATAGRTRLRAGEAEAARDLLGRAVAGRDWCRTADSPC